MITPVIHIVIELKGEQTCIRSKNIFPRFFSCYCSSTMKSHMAPRRPGLFRRIHMRFFPARHPILSLEQQERRNIVLAQERSLETEILKSPLLTDRQIESILKLYDKDKMDGWDPTRPGEDYSKQKKAWPLQSRRLLLTVRSVI